ncbi:NAD-binding protein [Schizopora paradoxa]|uniref:NAD-binding protein n=1 Tax=Schizopora paradoxa TaxID=27342 RepID=A0A0H2RF08_9AGAM|nr:NAD-binding protein [Schizopora paradoxa]
MSPIKTCVLGVGLSGLTFHVPFLLALPELFELYAVLERNPKSPGGKVKERFGVDVKIHKSFEDVLKDEAIELVIVGTPNATHYGFVKGSLEAGKHVLVDKPAVPSSAEASELGALANSKGLVLYAYQNRRWDSDFLALRRLLSEPRSSPASLGDIVEFESHFDRYRNDLKNSWKKEDQPGAGQVYDLGAHLIDQVVVLFGRPASVTGFIANVRGLGNQNVDDSFTIILQYPANKSQKLSLTVILRAHILSVRSPQLRYIVRGSKGTFVKYGLDVQEDQLKIMPDPKGIFTQSFGREPDEISGTIDTIDSNGIVKQQPWPTLEKGAYVELFRNLAAAIRTGAETAVNWEEVIAQLEIIELAHASSKEGRTINLTPSA